MNAYAGAQGGVASPAGFSAASRPVRLSAAVLREVPPPAGAHHRETSPRTTSSTASHPAPSGPFLPNSTDRAIAREIGDLISEDSMERVAALSPEMGADTRTHTQTHATHTHAHTHTRICIPLPTLSLCGGFPFPEMGVFAPPSPFFKSV